MDIVTLILAKNFTKAQIGTVASGISKVEYDETTSKIKVTYTNGDVIEYTIPTIVGPKGDDGEDGRGIKNAVLNDDYTLTLTFTDDTTYTTPSIRGAQGPTGRDGANTVEAGTGIQVDYDSTNKKYTISNTQTSAEWGNIEGDIADQEDLSEALGTAETKATWGNINGTLSNQTDLNSALETKATLVNGRIPLQQMPEFVVADVVEVETYEDLPETGETNTLYHVILTDSTYRWIGNNYLLISQQSNFYSLLIDANIATMGALKEAVDSVNTGGDHVFFDLHQLVNEGYVCTVHFWDETVNGTVHHYCEINDILNDRLYGIKQEWTSEQLVSDYCSVQGRMYDIKKVSLNGTALENDRGFVDIPIGSTSNPGVYKTNSGYGIYCKYEGTYLGLTNPSDAELEAKTNTSKAVLINNIDKAVMEGLGNNALTWTDTYKSSARTTIGAGTPVTITVVPEQ